jgi:hypothetical protein
VTATQWAKLVARINASYDRQQLAPETAAMWFEELCRFDHDVVLAVFREHLRTSPYRPSCAELYQAAAALRAARPGAAALPARERHGEPLPDHLREALRAAGLLRPKRPPADDRADAAALEANRQRQLAALAAMTEAAS